jgi:hypothetical protein
MGIDLNPATDMNFGDDDNNHEIDLPMHMDGEE